ncbi:MAG: hypothetical protein NVS3B21_14750 [Acidimicrobiales bacterium]
MVDAMFGVVNIPNAVWIDEEGMIVRPAEPAWPERPRPAESSPPAEKPTAPPTAAPAMPARAVRMFEAVGRGKIDRTRYVPAIRDWVANGAASRFVLDADAVIARSQPRGLDEAEGAAHFELAQHLWQEGDRDAARRHFREAHRLQPDNWTYKRQAWSIEPSQLGPGMERYWQGPVEGVEAEWPYEGDFLTDLETLQAQERDYYPLPEDMRP